MKHYEYSVTTQKVNEYLILIEPWCCLSAGSTITPNYVDNSTSSVAPWCSCSASGSRREDCDRFLEYFTDNICLRECHSIHNVLESTNTGFWGRGYVCIGVYGGQKHSAILVSCLTGAVQFQKESCCVFLPGIFMGFF